MHKEVRLDARFTQPSYLADESLVIHDLPGALALDGSSARAATGRRDAADIGVFVVKGSADEAQARLFHAFKVWHVCGRALRTW